jgi:predicted regulator of Ras-like GTPase activity (Roadblock/LC7/MglB family)
MSQQIPGGTPIGKIEASLDWLLSHTPRFFGAILVRIYTGEGFILIERGRPVGFSFRLGNRVLLGAAAWQFFDQQEFMNASLLRYTDEEFRKAMVLAGPDALVPGAREKLKGIIQGHGSAPVATTGTRGMVRGHDSTPVAISTGTQGHGSAPVATATGLRMEETAAHISRQTEPAAPFPARITFEDHTPEAVLDCLSPLPGIAAIAIFREGSIVDCRGKTSLDNLVMPAEDILLSAWEILALLSTGPLAQFTLQLSGMSVSIVPFMNGYLLILTEPNFNLGQIRKLVHDVARAAG